MAVLLVRPTSASSIRPAKKVRGHSQGKVTEAAAVPLPPYLCHREFLSPSSLVPCETPSAFSQDSTTAEILRHGELSVRAAEDLRSDHTMLIFSKSKTRL